MLPSVWFPEEDDEVGALTAEEAGFVDALRREAELRGMDSGPTALSRDQSAQRLLIACADLVRVDFGASFDGSSVSCGQLHNQVYYVMPGYEPAADAVGTPEELGVFTAGWFDALLRRPVVRHEWVHRDKVYASKTYFADTGRGLSTMFNRDRAPFGAYFRRDLGPADRVVHVRGDLTGTVAQ